jgi:hypothetical protein
MSSAEGLSLMSTVTTTFWGIISLTTLTLLEELLSNKYARACLSYAKEN